MSADLLRRAAVKLREHAQAAPTGPWGVQYFGDRGFPQRVSSDRAELVANTYDGPPAPAGSAEYIALVHPPVALALAELLDQAAAAWAIDFAEPVRNPRDRSMVFLAAALAREILREPS